MYASLTFNIRAVATLSYIEFCPMKLGTNALFSHWPYLASHIPAKESLSLQGIYKKFWSVGREVWHILKMSILPHDIHKGTKSRAEG